MFKNKILKNIFSLTLAEIATKGILFFLNTYIAHVFDVEGYGIIISIIAILSYIQVLVRLGFDMVGVRSIAQRPEDKEKIVNNIISLKLAIGAVVFIALCVYIYFSNESILIKTALLFGGFQIFSTIIQIDWFYIGMERMEIIGLRQFLLSAITLLGVTLFVKDGKDIPIYIGILSFSSIINGSWLVILYVKQYAKIKFVFSRAYWKELLKSSFFISISGIAIQIINSFNLVYVGYVCSDYENGLFGSSFKLYAFLMLPSIILQNVVGPMIARAKTTEERRNVISKYSKIIAVCATIVITIVYSYSHFFITLIYTENFLPAIPILQLFMIVIAFGYYNTTVFPPLITWNKEKKIMYFMGIAAAINIIVSLCIVSVLGGIGAAIASICSEVFTAISLSYLVYKETKKTHFMVFLKLGGIAVVAILIAKYLLIYINNDIIEIILTFIITIALVFLLKIIKVQDIKEFLKK